MKIKIKKSHLNTSSCKKDSHEFCFFEICASYAKASHFPGKRNDRKQKKGSKRQVSSPILVSLSQHQFVFYDNTELCHFIPDIAQFWCVHFHVQVNIAETASPTIHVVPFWLIGGWPWRAGQLCSICAVVISAALSSLID